MSDSKYDLLVDPTYRLTMARLPLNRYPRNKNGPEHQEIIINTSIRRKLTEDNPALGLAGWWVDAILPSGNTHFMVHESDIDFDIDKFDRKYGRNTKDLPSSNLSNMEKKMNTSSDPNYREKLKNASMEAPSGVTVLAKRVECSVLTARKHLERLVQNGEIQVWVGPRGKVYGDFSKVPTSADIKREVNKMSSPPKIKKGYRMVAQGRIDNKRVRLRVVVKRTTKSGIKIQVETSEGVSHTMVWDANSGGYVVKFKSGRLVARP